MGFERALEQKARLESGMDNSKFGIRLPDMVGKIDTKTSLPIAEQLVLRPFGSNRVDSPERTNATDDHISPELEIITKPVLAKPSLAAPTNIIVSKFSEAVGGENALQTLAQSPGFREDMNASISSPERKTTQPIEGGGLPRASIENELRVEEDDDPPAKSSGAIQITVDQSLEMHAEQSNPS